MNSPDLVSLLASLSDSFVFRERPEPIHYSLRADYRISLILLMLHFCGYKGQAGLVKLHVLNWASRKLESKRALMDRLKGRAEFFDVPLRFDPAFNRAIDLARGAGLVSREASQAIMITELGRGCVDDILKDDSLLLKEKGFFQLVGRKLTAEKLKEITNPRAVW
jgi:hypothetical protein